MNNFKYSNTASYESYKKIMNSLSEFPFYYTYGNVEYKGFDSGKIVSQHTDKLPEKETTTIKFKLDKSMDIELVTAFYHTHGVMEWTVWFKNNSDKNSAVVENPRVSMDFDGDNPELRGIYGDHDMFYEEYKFDLSERNVHFQSDSGRATHVYFPYFNLEYGSGGAMLAIGWAGTWTADFVRTDSGVTYTARSVNNLSTYLKPGEKIRTALFVVAPYTVRDEYYATNFWRSWYMECNLPKADAKGNDLKPFSTCFLAYDTGRTNSDGSISERYDTWRPSMEKILSENLRFDFRWFDAGWYIAPDMGSAEPFVDKRDWWDTVGTWELDPAKWPGKTFLESTDFAREHGMKTLMWFEPERVTYVDELVKNFGYKKEWAIVQDGVNSISNNIGDEECRKWTLDRVCKTLRENKVEMYREDNNSDPAQLWDFLDSKEGSNRRGITECKFIFAHYDMWDKIIACTLSYGGCGYVDSCASGGGRNDLESMRRGVPMLRSDFDRLTTGIRLSMTTSFNKWIPFTGANTKEKKGMVDLTGDSDLYIWRASYLPILNVDSQYVHEPQENFELMRFAMNEWRQASPYMLKDFYVLTPWRHREDVSSFTAYSYFDENKSKGVIFAFRQEKCEETTLKVRLPYAKKGKIYSITDKDTGEVCRVTFDELEKYGICLEFANPRTARLLWVKEEEI